MDLDPQRSRAGPASCRGSSSEGSSHQGLETCALPPLPGSGAPPSLRPASELCHPRGLQHSSRKLSGWSNGAHPEAPARCGVQRSHSSDPAAEAPGDGRDPRPAARGCVCAPGVQPCMAPRRGPSTVRSGRGTGVGTPCLAPFLTPPLTGGAAIGRPARPRPPFPPCRGGGSTHRPGLGRLWGAAGVCKSALGPSGCGGGTQRFAVSCAGGGCRAAGSRVLAGSPETKPPLPGAMPRAWSHPHC